MRQTPASFLFILVLFKHKLYKKTVDFSWIQTQIVRVEVEHADQLTSTTALVGKSLEVIFNTLNVTKINLLNIQLKIF